MQWIFFALVSMIGTTLRYLTPKIFGSVNNPFSVLFWTAPLILIVTPILSKIFFGHRIEFKSINYGILSRIGGGLLATSGLLLAFRTGGKMGPIAIIIESSVVISIILSTLIRKEKMSFGTAIGCFITFIGIIITIRFSNK